MDRVELLSPAGDLERLKVTLLYGADAVYIGGEKYGLRANATNFTLDEIREGCLFAHKLGKKVYLTLNIVFHNEDMDGVEKYIDDVVDCGIDAFIVSDPFIISYIKKNYNVEVHLSTQNSTSNYKAVEFFKGEGVDRIVLAREVSLEEMKEICSKCKIDIEVFIHGAMCTCFSGRCALSNYVTNRDANRGGCSQVCRFSFTNPFEEKDFTIALKDNNLSLYIPSLIEAGVKSLKVEGRMRSLYYLATVIGSYREIIDSYYDGSMTDSKMKRLEERLRGVANRETSSHYLLKDADYTDQYYTGRGEASNQDYLGQVISYDKTNHLIEFYERNYFEVGDVLELFTPSGEYLEFPCFELFDSLKNPVEVARHPDQIYYLSLKTDIKIVPYSMIKIVRRKHETL